MTYYRTATFLLPPDDRLFNYWENMQRCFLKAADLFPLSIEPLEVQIDEWPLTGYFMAAADDGTPRPTLVMLGGGETFASELYFWTGVAGVERGYNVLLTALPAQPAGAIQGVDSRELMERYSVIGAVQHAVRAYTTAESPPLLRPGNGSRRALPRQQPAAGKPGALQLVRPGAGA